MDIYDLFSPFKNHDQCLWFYLLSVIGFILVIFAIISGIYYGITQKKNSSFYLSIFFVSTWYFIFYFQNRLLYSMCVKTI